MNQQNQISQYIYIAYELRKIFIKLLQYKLIFAILLENKPSPLGESTDLTRREHSMKTQKTKTKVTLQQISEQCNVSITTISRVLNGDSSLVKQASQDKIIACARSMGYFDNRIHSTQSIPHIPKKSMAIIIPSFQNLFFSQLIIGAEFVAQQSNITPYVISSQRSATLERKQIHDLIQRKIDTLILASVDYNTKTLQHYLDAGGQACLIEQDFSIPEKVAIARVNMIEVGYMATNYLISCGHKKIAFASSPITKESRWLTLEGCRMAMTRHTLEFAEEDIVTVQDEQESTGGLYEFDTGRALANILLSKPKHYTAVVAVNDMVAYGLINTFQQCGIAVPEDISVIGIDNLTYSSMMLPGLTSVDTSARTLGMKAAQILLQDTANGTPSDDLLLTVPPKLVVRDSVKIISEG